MWYLILVLCGSNFIQIPEKYPTEQSCRDAAEVWIASNISKHISTCVPAPKLVNTQNCISLGKGSNLFTCK